MTPNGSSRKSAGRDNSGSWADKSSGKRHGYRVLGGVDSSAHNAIADDYRRRGTSLKSALATSFPW